MASHSLRCARVGIPVVLEPAVLVTAIDKLSRKRSNQEFSSGLGIQETIIGCIGLGSQFIHIEFRTDKRRILHVDNRSRVHNQLRRSPFRRETFNSLARR